VTYVIPLQGSFYVPPEFRDIVAKTAPIAGDFAVGVRDYSKCYLVAVGVYQPVVDDPDS